MPKEERTPFRSSITTLEEGPLELERSPEATATSQEEDTATSREKPPATMQEEAPR